jgi:uncharacterized protein (TIGR02996 family)
MAAESPALCPEVDVSADATALREAVLETPEDPAAWNVYADWLTDHGFDVPAEHVRAVASAIEAEGSAVVRHVALHASREGADAAHVALCDALRAARDDAALLAAIEDLITDRGPDLINTEEVASAAAETNAHTWGLDMAEVVEFWFDAGSCVASFTFEASGEQREDATGAGTTVTGAAKLRVSEDGSTEFTDITAEVYFGDEEHEDDGDLEYLLGDEG